MTVWDDLKPVIARLADEQPGALQGYPDPGSDEGRQPPFAIYLAPWAATTAGDLFDRFGDDVSLTVGALPFPPGRARERRHEVAQRADPLDPDQATAELDDPAVVRSGHTIRHGILLSNHSTDELRVFTNGQLTAVVVDPETEQVVGG